ncbi:alpha/beta fold hydrolase [bacterium]|nr:alpha/beta fold hydrolase [bacterium]
MGTVLNISRTEEYSQPGVMRLDFESEVDGFQDWALALPNESSDVWFVTIHGHGSTADQLFTRTDIREHWLGYCTRHGFSVLCPNVRGNSWMGPAAAADLHNLLREVRAHFGVSKFIFMSGSMGGTSNLIYSILHPEDVAGIVSFGAASDLSSYHAFCRASDSSILHEIADAIEAAYGGLPYANQEIYQKHSTLLNASRIVVPTVVMHGTADAIIPVSQTRALAAAMGNKPDFAYIEVPGGDHDSPLLHVEVVDWVVGSVTK